MNDMPRDLHVSESLTREQWLERAHVFRSKLIERCAQVERWATKAANSILPPATGKSRPVMVLLGHKIEEVRDLARKHPDRFGNAVKVIERLDQFQPYAELRSELAHATTEVVILENGEAQLQFNNAGLCHQLIERRIVLTGEAVRQIAKDLADLTNQIQQLSTKPGS